MKGFIEINQEVCSRATLINVAWIESVVQCQNCIRIYMANDNTNPWEVKESYDEITNKIKEAMDE